MGKTKIFGLAGLVLILIVSIALAFSIKSTRISTIIVPHHNLVASERSNVFKDISGSVNSKKIILLSTNHYDNGVSAIQTQSKDFETANGTIKVDNVLLGLALDNGVSESPITFEIEHGIKTILPDIAEYLPNSSMLPLIIKESTSKESIFNLISKLHESCKDCVVIASVDFSHYQPYLLSNLHDDLTRRAMQSLDYKLIEEKAEIGEPLVLSAAIRWAILSGTQKFVEQNHTNSSEIENNYYAEGTSHFFGWYQEGRSIKSDNEVTFTFAGDIMFDRKIRDRFHPRYDDVVAKLGNRVLWGTDLVMANLEGPITNYPKIPTYADMPSFAFSPNIMNTLKKLHFTDLAIKNNHSFDAGEKGLEDTKKVLTDKNIGFFNGTMPQIINGNNQRIIVFNIDKTKNEKLDVSDLANYQNINDNIVIYIHWGPEYQDKPSTTQKETAHELIDAGADMIIGVGPHVIQPAELYKNRPIVYSLGNFIFDMNDSKETSFSLLIMGKFTEDNIILQPMLTESNQLQPILLRSLATDDKIKNYFNEFSDLQTEDSGGIQFTISK